MGEFLMPSLGADMESGTIVEWMVEPGDAVQRGDIVAVVDTEKSDIDVEVFESGVVEELLVEPGVKVPVGTPLALITPVAGEGARHVTRPVARPVAPTAAQPAAQPEAVGAASATVRTATRSSPLARRLAAETGIDLDAVRGTGPGGAVVVADLERAPRSAERDEAPIPPETQAEERPSAMRSVIGERMARSKQQIPHYYVGTTIDLSRSLGWMADVNESRPVSERLLPAALLLRATALAAVEVPSVNGTFTDGLHLLPHVHLGVAVALRGGGLVVPTIQDADQLPLDQLMAGLRDVVDRARHGRLRGSDLSDATITVTNLGDRGVEEVYGIIHPPQVALVGFGAVVERPWVADDGSIVARPVVRATLSADHRASDGHDGARFLTTIDHLLHHPEEL